MLEAGIWGLVAASSLLIGAAAAVWLKPKDRTIALLLGFGAGALISALAFELTEEAFALGGTEVVAAGLGAGALAYYLGSRAIGGGSARALLLGATLDGVPETAVLGITVLEGEVSAALLAAIFISNLPEAASGADLSVRKGASGWSERRILGSWALVTIACALAAALGFVVLDGASGDVVGFIQAFAGGAVLMTLATTMLPEAHELSAPKQHRRRGEEQGQTIDPTVVGLATVLGFAATYLLTTLN